MSRKKIGLALGSGSARGLAHIGVLEVLEREGIPIDMIAGTSVGALVGALYAQGRSIARIKEIASNMGWARLLPLVDLTLPRTGLIGGRRITSWLRLVLGRDVEFKDLEIPFMCVATDIMTGREVIIDKGSVLEAVRASFSIPGLFTMVNREGRYLVDGGLVNPVPVDVVKSMGAEFVIAVNVLSDIDSEEQAYWTGGKGKAAVKEPNIFEVLMQSIYIGSNSLARNSLRHADIAIEPRVAHIGPAEFHRGRECILQGEFAAKDRIAKLKYLLSGT